MESVKNIFISIITGIILILIYWYSFQPKCIIVKNNKDK